MFCKIVTVQPCIFLPACSGQEALGRQPYEDLVPKALMKTSFQRTFNTKSSQG
jgi:hypothetical protein